MNKKVYNVTMNKYISKSVIDTENLAKSIADKCKGGEIILLNGDLGAGKTTFTKGFAKSLGINDNITSPTFTLMKQYNTGIIPLFHFDLYRITDEDEIAELGFEEYFEMQGICVIEWNKFANLNGKLIIINIKYINKTTREFEIIYKD